VQVAIYGLGVLGTLGLFSASLLFSSHKIAFIWTIFPTVVVYALAFSLYWHDSLSGKNITIRITLEEHEAGLHRLEERLRKERTDSIYKQQGQGQQLEIELDGVWDKIANLQQSFEEEKQRRVAAIKALERFKSELPGTRLNQARAQLQSGDAKAAEELFDDIVEKGSTSVALAAYQSGQLAENRSDFTKSMQQYQKALTLEENNPDYLLAAGNMARVLGHYQKAQHWFEGLLHLRKVEAKETVELAQAQDRLASVAQDQGRYEEAEELFRQALEIDEKTIGRDHPDYSTRLNNLAVAVRAQGRYEEAEELYRQALKIDEETIGRDHPDYSTRLNNLAVAVRAQGRYEEAEKLYRQALIIDEKTIGNDHPGYARHINNLALVVKLLGRHKEAEELYRQALEIDKETIGRDHPRYAIHLSNLALLVHAQGRDEEAERLFLQVQQILEETIGMDHPDYATLLNNLALVVHALGRYGEAEKLYRQALAIGEETIGKNHRDYANRLNNLAGALQAQERYEEAKELYRQALELCNRILGPDHPLTRKIKYNLDALTK